jgi:transposase
MEPKGVHAMRSKRKRRHHTTEQKAAIVRRHLVDKVPVSDLCDEYKIQPSVFYGWLRHAMEHLPAALEPNGQRRAAQSREAELEGKIKALEAKLTKKDNVIAEISEEMVSLKKELGEP